MAERGDARPGDARLGETAAAVARCGGAEVRCGGVARRCGETGWRGGVAR